MKTFALLSTFLFVSSGFVLAESETAPQILTQAEADAVIESEMTVKADREADRRAELQKIPANQEWVVDLAGQRTTFRHIDPPTREPRSSIDDSTDDSARIERLVQPEQARPHVNFTLFVTVFDDEMTEIRVAPLNEGISVVSRVAFTHLPAIEAVETEDVSFSFFSFVERASAEAGTTRLRPDPTLFSATPSQYIVYTDTEDDVPPDLREAIDALHRHYLKHEADFEARAQRAEALREARLRFEKENPPPAQETVVNFFPIRSNVRGSASK